ncbi:MULTISPECIES: DUF72 domain-containing protein [unclassified Janthinobacterium]|uniref:DUF72 domain-containing protein n=1 Tax=unclassified Janthinobacterium TaxID=2610881 RepID=UPI00034C63DD|nr:MULTISPECIES: DUF72 domain-containing protein [unclassified Janthinobacterium]MEC5159846.1 uncharacterized protein YecE (DUF72 family) [Janthinobacterium sp. CG_S6]
MDQPNEHDGAAHRGTPARPGSDLVGTAGWSIARDAAPLFPAHGSQLERYAAVFGAVEINSSFYRPHQPKTYARWRDSVPPAFRFSVKLPRAITHERRLSDIAAPLAQFAGQVGELQDKLGCVLVQLPPSLAFHPAGAADFMARLRDSFDCMIACEARHASWFADAAGALLRRHAVTRVAADPPKGQPGAHAPTTAASYTRLHGNPRVYYSSYPDDFLRRLAEQLAAGARAGDAAWVVFDNTAAGAALPNALAVRANVAGLRPAE